MFFNQNTSKEVSTEIENLEEKIRALPDGKIIITKNSNNYKWYESSEKGLTYIPKSKRDIAEQLSLKKYLLLKKDALIKKERAIKYTNDYKLSLHCIEDMLLNSSYQELLLPYFKNDFANDWSNSAYHKNNNYPDQLIHQTISGNVVRSKSEAIIDMGLFQNHISFRYECALTINNATFFPDFTIMHPKTSEIYYWEHFGMIDNLSYAKNAFTKLELYTQSGIIPSINLITTFEDKNHPLSSAFVDGIIKQYFL